MKLPLLCSLLLQAQAPAACPECEAGALPSCGRTLASLTALKRNFPRSSSNRYKPPNDEEINALTASIGALLSGDPLSAMQAALLSEYKLCALDAPAQEVALLRPSKPGSGRSIIALRVREA